VLGAKGKAGNIINRTSERKKCFPESLSEIRSETRMIGDCFTNLGDAISSSLSLIAADLFSEMP
jgi:hypothetical protein